MRECTTIIPTSYVSGVATSVHVVYGDVPPPRGPLEYLCCSHAWSQIFKTCPVSDFPFGGKTPLNKNFVWFHSQFYTVNKILWVTRLWNCGIWKMTPKYIRIEQQKYLFFWKTDTFWKQTNKQTNKNFFGGGDYLVTHVYNINIRVPPDVPPKWITVLKQNP